MALSSQQAPWPAIQLAARAIALEGGSSEQHAQQPHSAYYVDLASDEDEGAIIEAQMDDILEDLELLFQEQIAVLAEDAAEQNALRKGKAVMIDHNPTEPRQQQDYPAIMVLEESASSPSTRPVELITPQPGGGSR